MKKYKWNKKSLIILCIKEFLMGNEENPELILNMLENANINKHKYKDLFKRYFDITNVEQTFRLYMKDSTNIDNNLAKSHINMFKDFNDFDILGYEENVPTINMSDDDLVIYVHDIIKSFNLRGLLSLYETLLKEKHINIQSSSNKAGIQGATFYGETTYLKNNKKAYINIYRNNTIIDIDTLVHEMFHAYFYNYFYKYYHYGIELLTELEGKFASLYAIEYMKKDKLKGWDVLLKDFIYEHLYISFQLYVNEFLFQCSPHGKYNLTKTNKEVQKLFSDKEIIFDAYWYESIIGVNKYECLVELISFLTALEISGKYDDPLKIVKLIYVLKYQDNNNIIELLNKYNLNYLDNNFKTLKKIHNNMNKTTKY